MGELDKGFGELKGQLEGIAKNVDSIRVDMREAVKENARTHTAISTTLSEHRIHIDRNTQTVRRWGKHVFYLWSLFVGTISGVLLWLFKDGHS